jgi:hypothetical protein
MRSLWHFGTGGGDMAMELAGLTPGGKAGIMGLAAIRRKPDIVYNLPKSVYKKHKTALETGKGGSRMGLDYLSYMSPKFAIERILAPALGNLKKAREYRYAITSEGKHYFKHKETGRYKVIPATRQEIADPKTLMLPDLRIGTKAYARSNRSKIKRQKEIAKDADLMKVRKKRLQVEDAADDLYQLGDPQVPAEVKAATLERFEKYPDAVKRAATKLLDDIGGPGGGAGAGLPSLKGKYPNWFSPEEATRMDNLLTPIKGDIPIVNEFKEGYKLIHTTPNYNNIPKNKRLKNILTKKKLSALNPNEASVLKQNIMNVTEEELLQLRVLSVNDKKRHLQGYLKEIEREARAGFGKELDILDTILGY